jgi:hypothetical protein
MDEGFEPGETQPGDLHRIVSTSLVVASRKLYQRRAPVESP